MKNKQFIVLDDDGKLHGYMIGYIENLNKKRSGYKFKADKIGYLENVFITKDYRGQGYFSQFMNQFIDFLKKKKVNNCALHVSIKNNAVKIYEKFGFEKDEYKMIMKIK